jgi:DUF1680 family protein
MSKVSLSALLVVLLASSQPLAAQQQPGHEGHNHPPGQGHGQQPQQPQQPGHEGHNHPPGQGHDHAPTPAKPAVPTGPVRLTPVGAERVELQAGLIGSRFEVNRTVTLPALLAHCESNGFVQNFAIAAGTSKGERRGALDSDAQVYAWIEAAALSLAQVKDPAMAAKVDELVDAVVAAQKDDGYLNTYFSSVAKGGAWSDLAGGRELYVGGRLIDAALAVQNVTKKTKLLEAARKFADHVDKTFGPGKKSDPSGHPGIERALARLSEATGEARYLVLAKFFVDARGNVAGRSGYGALAQDKQPLRAETEFLGDPLRGADFYAGATAVARIMPDPTLAAPLDAIWTDGAKKKTNIVGALGNASKTDGITAPFDVGSDTTFDTRSAIGQVEWSHEMFLATGDAKYADMVDRALHNAVLGGTSLAGTAHACVNRLASAGDVERSGLPACGDCAADIARFMADTPGLIFATGGNTIYISQFVPCKADFKINDQTVHIQMDTKWPYGGLVDIKVQTDKQVTFSIKFRRPAWCKQVFYQHDLKEQEHSTDYQGTEAGWEVYERRYDPLDGCKINLLGPIRREAAPAEIAGDKGRVAVCRGPLVYALEGVDNRGSARAMILPESAALTPIDRPDNVLTSIRMFRSRDGKMVDASGSPMPRNTELLMLPYYLLGNRAKSDFVVWVAATPDKATPPSAPPR